MAKLILHNYNMTLKFKNCQQCFVMRLWFKILFSVSDPHQDDADPDPRIRIGRFGSGSETLTILMKYLITRSIISIMNKRQ